MSTAREHRQRAIGLSLLLLVALAACPRVGRAANEEGIFVSTEALLLGGAVRTVIRDGGAVWLNPARLAEVDRRSMMANINALTFRTELIRDGLVVEGGESRDLRLTQVNMLPGSLSMGISLSEQVSLGFGMFVTRSDISSQRLRLDTQVGDRSPEAIITLDGRDQDYNGVLGVGWRVGERSSYGVSLVLGYSRATSTVVSWNWLQLPGYQELYGSTLQQQFTQLGVGVIVGGNWKLSDELGLSLVIQQPSLRFLDIQRSTQVEAESLLGPAASEIRFGAEVMNQIVVYSRLMGSTRLHLGVAWERGDVLVSGEAEFRLEPKVNGRGVVPVGNARVGAQWRVNDVLLIGGGVFTDLTQRVPLSGFFSERATQFLGASFGARLTRTIQLGEAERHRTIMRSTVFGAHYAAGLGRFSGTRIRLDADEGSSEALTRRFGAHELSLYLGAEFAF